MPRGVTIPPSPDVGKYHQRKNGRISMKLKLTALILVLALSLCLLAGCGEKSNNDGKVNVKVILVLEDGSEVPVINPMNGITRLKPLPSFMCDRPDTVIKIKLKKQELI